MRQRRRRGESQSSFVFEYRTELLEVSSLPLGHLVLLAGLSPGGAAAPDGHRLGRLRPGLGEGHPRLGSACLRCVGTSARHNGQRRRRGSSMKLARGAMRLSEGTHPVLGVDKAKTQSRSPDERARGGGGTSSGRDDSLRDVAHHRVSPPRRRIPPDARRIFEPARAPRAAPPRPIRCAASARPLAFAVREVRTFTRARQRRRARRGCDATALSKERAGGVARTASSDLRAAFGSGEFGGVVDGAGDSLGGDDQARGDSQLSFHGASPVVKLMFLPGDDSRDVPCVLVAVQENGAVAAWCRVMSRGDDDDDVRWMEMAEPTVPGGPPEIAPPLRGYRKGAHGAVIDAALAVTEAAGRRRRQPLGRMRRASGDAVESVPRLDRRRRRRRWTRRRVSRSSRGRFACRRWNQSPRWFDRRFPSSGRRPGGGRTNERPNRDGDDCRGVSRRDRPARRWRERSVGARAREEEEEAEEAAEEEEGGEGGGGTHGHEGEGGGGGVGIRRENGCEAYRWNANLGVATARVNVAVAAAAADAVAARIDGDRDWDEDNRKKASNGAVGVPAVALTAPGRELLAVSPRGEVIVASPPLERCPVGARPAMSGGSDAPEPIAWRHLATLGGFREEFSRAGGSRRWACVGSVAARGSFLHVAWCFDDARGDRPAAAAPPPRGSVVPPVDGRGGGSTDAVATAPEGLAPSRGRRRRRRRRRGAAAAAAAARAGRRRARRRASGCVTACESGGTAGVFRLEQRVPASLAASIDAVVDGSLVDPYLIDPPPPRFGARLGRSVYRDECAGWGGSAEGAPRRASLALVEPRRPPRGVRPISMTATMTKAAAR